MFKKKYIWDNVNTLENYTGGAKARKDISIFLKRKKYISVPYFNSRNLFFKLVFLIVNFILFPFLIEKNSILFVQYPFNKGQRFLLRLYKRIKHINCIFLIHDLESIRMNLNIEIEKRDLLYADYLIGLNENIVNYINDNIKENIPSSILNLWDYYICDCYDEDELQVFDLRNPITAPCKKIKVLISGNLSSQKARYLNQLSRIKNVHFYLLGQGYKDQYCSNITYLGSFDPNKPVKFLLNKEEAVYGLIWDGDSILNCEGYYGNYLKYNLPHKTSFYLANKMPIITWKNACISNFLVENKVAFTIDSLLDLADLNLKNILIQENHINKLNLKIKQGYFLTNALKDLGI